MTEQSPLELGETKQEPAYIVLQHANYMERELGRLWLNGDDAKEKATFIVRAVNCHKELVEALDIVLPLLDEMAAMRFELQQPTSDIHRTKGRLAAALAKAKEAQLQQQDLDEETL